MSIKHCALGIDQGTTGTFVGLMDVEGEMLGRAYKTHRQFYPQPGWVEQDPIELWNNARDLMNDVVTKTGVRARDIAGIGIANQGESVVLWDRETGRPLYNVLVWQDTRTQPDMEKLAADPEVRREISARTGLLPDSYFSASKIRWVLDHVPEAQNLLNNGRLCCGTLDTWLIWKLTEGRSFVTDPSTASRTLLFNIHTLTWDDWLLDAFGLPVEIMPRVLASTADFGVVSSPEVNLRGVPILASLVDQPAAMAGQGCLRAGQIKATYGSGCFVNLNTGQRPVTSSRGLLTTLVWRRDETTTYGLDGGVLTAGSTVNWLKDSANLITAVEEIDDLCAKAPDSGGVMWIPAQTGIGPPYWDRAVRGMWLGISLATERAHLVRAVLEGIALCVVQVVLAMLQDSGLAIAGLRVDGGLTNSKALMQMQADWLGYPVQVLADPQATARGVCSLAARQAGLWLTDEPIERQVRIAHIYEPALSADQRAARLADFEKAISLLRTFHRHA